VRTVSHGVIVKALGILDCAHLRHLKLSVWAFSMFVEAC